MLATLSALLVMATLNSSAVINIQTLDRREPASGESQRHVLQSALRANAALRFHGLGFVHGYLRMADRSYAESARVNIGKLDRGYRLCPAMIGHAGKKCSRISV